MWVGIAYDLGFACIGLWFQQFLMCGLLAAMGLLLLIMLWFGKRRATTDKKVDTTAPQTISIGPTWYPGAMIPVSTFTAPKRPNPPWSTSSVPDLTDYVVGWREWYLLPHPDMPEAKLYSGYNIMSTTIEGVSGPYWPFRKPLESVCAQSEVSPCNHEGHQVGHGCGIYAYKNDSLWIAPCWGKVALWGRIVEHEDGYRAQYAYPLELHVKEEKLADELRINYGCEVVVEEHHDELTEHEFLSAWGRPTQVHKQFSVVMGMLKQQMPVGLPAIRPIWRKP